MTGSDEDDPPTPADDSTIGAGADASAADRVPIGSAPLDDLLGGGLERGTVTQVYGPPAAGKTTIALRAAVETAARAETAVYIDTEGLSVDRLEQLLRARSDDVDAVSARIRVMDVHDFDEQDEAVHAVADVADQPALVVLDTATGFYRLRRTTGTGDPDEALRDVTRQVAHLLSLARRHRLAVLITNQVYADPESDQTRPLGGHTLGHWTGTTVRLDRFRGGRRRATLTKHRSQAAGETVTVSITDTGLPPADAPSR